MKLQTHGSNFTIFFTQQINYLQKSISAQLQSFGLEMTPRQSARTTWGMGKIFRKKGVHPFLVKRFWIWDGLGIINFALFPPKTCNPKLPPIYILLLSMTKEGEFSRRKILAKNIGENFEKKTKKRRKIVWYFN